MSVSNFEVHFLVENQVCQQYTYMLKTNVLEVENLLPSSGFF